jgi:N-methylhydantoinase A|tara:strand:+ start:4022 stop:6115 length:2094 start_codon:yes stop_codon:yes gene_type:complete
MTRSPSVRLAADIGGTFTDIVLETDAGRYTTKVLTTSEAPERGAIAGIDKALNITGISPTEVDVLIHGTTLATNALIERKGAKTAFLTTEGFRDILEMGFEKRFEHYDVFMDKPTPLVPRPLRRPVRERVSGRGQVLLPLDTDQVREIGRELKEADVEAIAVGLLHSYAFPDHECVIREILSEELPGVTICLSSDVCPEIREYERFSTTCANAYVRPLMSGYLLRFQDMLNERGIVCPLYLMMSGGGLTTLNNAVMYPIRIVESGPAGGAILGGHVARECGLDEALSFDMGGTTAKICLIQDGTPERSRSLEVARIYRDLKGSGLPIRIPVIEMVEIGAGGGSIAEVDEMGRITVGPASAGSEPGPACYDQGGNHATVTDANLALGKLDPNKFAGGKITLVPEKSEFVLNRDIGMRLDLNDHWPAVGVTEMVEENMTNAARVHAIERGKVIGRHTMVAFGGGAPLHAGRLAQKLGIGKVVIPKGAGVGSAIGFLLAPISYEVVRSRSVNFSNFDAGSLNTMLDEMYNEALGVVQKTAGNRSLVTTKTVELRYVGQGHDLPIPLDDRSLLQEDAKCLRSRFEELYQDIYGLRIEDMDIQSVSWSVTVATESERPSKARNPALQPEHQVKGTRQIYDAGLKEMVDHSVYWRFDLEPGAEIVGPAVIAEDETSTIVPAHFTASINSLEYIVMENQAKESA